MKDLRGSYVFLALLLNIFLFRGINAVCNDSLHWMRESSLDENGQMNIKWNFTDDDITMMMIGNTKGYIAVGFSPTKGLVGADVVVGWIQNGKVFLQDRFSPRGDEPILDDRQSYELLEGSENETHTMICFRRKLNTCDQQDLAIIKGTINVIWALNVEDPQQENGTIQYLSSKTGFKFVYVLGKVYPKPASEDVENFDVRIPNKVTVKTESGNTLYFCRNFKFPPFDSKRYMLGFETLIPEISQPVVHHVILYSCENKDAAKVFKYADPNGYNCLDPNTSKVQNPCNIVLAVWGMGIEDQYFPPNLGTPFGSESQNFYLKLEIHYNIPPEKQGVTDNSAMRIFITKKKPENEGGLIFFGSEITPLHLIPPRQKAFSTFAVCGGRCFQEVFPKKGSIFVTAIRFHSHLSGRKMRLRIFRNGTELEPLMDDYFDFDFQSFRFLNQEVEILSTDILVTECIYDTSDRDSTTIGSFPSEEEMCFSNIVYYPRIDLSWCTSFMDPKNILKLTGIEELKKPPECQGKHCRTAFFYPGITEDTPIIKPPELANETLRNHIKKLKDWTPEQIETLKKYYLQTQYPVCLTDEIPINDKEMGTVQFPTDAQQYIFQDSCSNLTNSLTEIVLNFVTVEN